MEQNISAMVTNTVNILRDNLHDRYDSGFPILKELIQNSNDAGASELLVTKVSGLKDSVHPLLKRDALLIVDDGKVTNEDLIGLVSVAKGGKTGKKGVIGKFGLGMKSIFHFCDMFFYIALQNGKSQVKMVNPFIDPTKNMDPFHPNWNNFSENDSNLVEHKALEFANNKKDGLILWLPLRIPEDHYKVINDIYTIDNIWKQSSLELEKNIALSLIALDISTPCNGSKRSLENIKIETQVPNISINFPLDANTIYSDGKEYCTLEKSGLIVSESGKQKLEDIIAENKFTKISYIDERGDERETLEYSENQNASIAIVRFKESDEKSIHFDWCSYLPLNSAADTVDFYEDLDSEYHILIHANFAIDSGRRNIVDFSKCFSDLFELKVSDIEDDRSSQCAWNCVLIRNYILPNLLKFVCEYDFDDVFMKSLYSTICNNNSGIGYYCLSEGFAFKYRDKNEAVWRFANTNNIKETAYLFLKYANKYSSDSAVFNDEMFYLVVLNVTKYIQNHTIGLDWAVVNANKNITEQDILEISKIAEQNAIPIFFIPFNKKFTSAHLFKINNIDLIVAFLLCFTNELKNIVGFVYEAICNDECIDKQLSSQIYANSDIKQFVPLFQLGRVNIQSTKYLAVYKTYDEVCEISKDLRLFTNYGVDNKNTYLHKYAKIFKGVDLYLIKDTVAKQQFFLSDQGTGALFRFDDPENDENKIKVLNCLNLNSVLKSMAEHNDLISQEDVKSCSAFITDTLSLSPSAIEHYQAIIRNIIVGHPVSNERIIFRHEEHGKDLERPNFYRKLLETYTDSELNGHFINPNIEVSLSFDEVLHISNKKAADLERKLLYEEFGINCCTPEEKEQLAEFLEDEKVYKSLKIHKTISGEFVTLIDYRCYLENESLKIPNGYKFPNDIKIIQKNSRIPLQRAIPELKPSDIVNIILCDDNIHLDSPSGIVLANYITSIIKQFGINRNDINPLSRNKKWIPGNNYSYYSLDEVIDNPRIGKSEIGKCDGLILGNQLTNDFIILNKFALQDDDKVLSSLITHHKKDGENKWPWFNVNNFNSIKNLDDKLILFKLLQKAEDPILDIVHLFYNENDTIEYLLNSVVSGIYINDKSYIKDKKINFIKSICSSYLEGDIVPDYLIKFLAELFSDTDISFGTQLLNNIIPNIDNLMLPSQNGKWQSISQLVNFKDDIPDLNKDNTLIFSLRDYFPKEEDRAGGNNTLEEIDFSNFVDKILKCKNKKLWGVFSYLISKQEDKEFLYKHGELFEKTTFEILEKMRIPKLQSSKIILHSTAGNYCISLTGNHVDLKDAENIDSVFYNQPLYDGNILRIDLFNNFMTFSSKSIEKAIMQLLDIFEINNIPDNFLLNLANPEQVPITSAINMIFTNIFNTLKVLKLEYRSGQYNLIAESWDKYQDACGKPDTVAMIKCINDVKTFVMNNSGKIQQLIRQKVISFIQDAEYRERCILFELFQNADDAYNQLKLVGEQDCYFKVNYINGTLSVTHKGRPINQYRVGSDKEYKSDLINMLNIGWSNKSELEKSQRQTGKFGYGFKTVYLICDEPHIISGDYNFIVKAALYPEVIKDDNEYFDETKIILKLNANGISKEEEILSDFRAAAKYQLLFSKKINNIKFNNENYKWEPNVVAELKDYIVQEDSDFLVFKTRPIFRGDSHDEQACIAFKKNGTNIVPFDESAPKIWCMAPLLEFKNIGFAMSANFKTNTGRQTLAIENQDNKNIIEKISKEFAEALLELWEQNIYRNIITQIINITFLGTTKTIFEPIPGRILNAFYKIGFIPDGVSKLYNFEGCVLYSLSASYFNDKIAKQFNTIKVINEFIKEVSSSHIIVITEIVATELKNRGIEVFNIDKIINILAMLLDKNPDITKQKEILIKFSESPLFDFVLNRSDERLSNCRIFDEDGELKDIKYVYNVSADYESAIETLEKLFTPTRIAYENSSEYYNTLQEESLNPEVMEYDDYTTFDDVYYFWKDSILSGSWKSKVEEYYANFYPSNITRNNLGLALTISFDDLNDYYNQDTMPEIWCTFILLAICQSIPAWNHTDATNRYAIDWLLENKLITKFCNGENLQDLYDLYLEKSGNNELYLRHFECLLRIYKIRKDFLKFYTLISQFPYKKNINSVRDFLDVSSDEELSGKGIVIDSNIRSLNFGIHTIFRELLINNFWGNIEDTKLLNKFAYTPRSFTLKVLGFSSDFAKSEDIFEEINDNIRDKDKKFLNWFDLPFIIYHGERND